MSSASMESRQTVRRLMLRRFAMRRFELGLVPILWISMTVACSGSNKPEPLPSQEPLDQAPPLELPEPVELPAPAPPPPIHEIDPTPRSTVKVIDAGGGEAGHGQPATLVEASRLAKAQKRGQQEPIATITDDNLREYAAGADVIMLESEPAAPGPGPEPLADAGEGSGAGGEPVRGEDHWRTRALELRMGWRRTVDRIQELELESAALRQQFYAEEDPYVRESQIKPAWDRILDRLDQLRERATRYEEDLDVFILEGQRAGALQGWLNQGWELEPTAEERERTRLVSDHGSIEPPILEDAAVDPPPEDPEQ